MSWEYYISEIDKNKSPLELVREIVSDNDLKSKSRDRQSVYTRQFLMWFLNRKTSLSLKDIGKEFNRDHATVIHAKKSYEDAASINDSEYFKYFVDIKEFLDHFNFPDKYKFHENKKTYEVSSIIDRDDYLKLRDVVDMKNESVSGFIRKLIKRSVSKYNTEKKVV